MVNVAGRWTRGPACALEASETKIDKKTAAIRIAPLYNSGISELLRDYGAVGNHPAAARRLQALAASAVTSSRRRAACTVRQVLALAAKLSGGSMPIPMTKRVLLATALTLTTGAAG